MKTIREEKGVYTMIAENEEEERLLAIIQLKLLELEGWELYKEDEEYYYLSNGIFTTKIKKDNEYNRLKRRFMKQRIGRILRGL